MNESRVQLGGQAACFDDNGVSIDDASCSGVEFRPSPAGCRGRTGRGTSTRRSAVAREVPLWGLREEGLDLGLNSVSSISSDLEAVSPSVR